MSQHRVHFRRPELKRARIEIIPMIDTIFFLLVFFLITSITQTKMNGMASSLPKAGPPSTAKTPPKAVVTDDKGGHLYINTTPVTLAQLGAQLQQKINGAPATIIIVNIEKKRKVQETISVMDAINRVQLPESAKTPTNNVPAVLFATAPVDADGNAAATPTAATGAGGAQ